MILRRRHAAPLPRRPTAAALPCLLAGALLLVGTGFPAPAALAGQTILNTERFQLSDVDGFHMSADFAIDGRRGNTEVMNVRTSGIVGVLSARHWTRLIFGGRYLSDRERSILDARFGQLRYSYLFSDRTRSFHFVQAQRNETLRLRSRWLVGSGIRRTVAESGRTSVALGTGLMAEWERLDADAVGEGERTDSRTVRMANQAIYNRELASGARVLNILYFQPDVTGFSDFRILNDLGLLVPVTEHLRLTLSAEWRRDTRPPAELRKDDLTFSMGLGVDFR